MANVTIGGTSPNNFTVTVPCGSFTAPVTFQYTNSSNGTCWLWYSVAGGVINQVQITVGGAPANVPVNAASDLQYNVTAPNAAQPPMSHIIHVGN